MFKSQKGITLVALAVTIVVLLILAGVTIAFVLSDDGVIQSAQEATTANDVAISSGTIKIKDDNTVIFTNVKATHNGKTFDVTYANGRKTAEEAGA